VVTVISTGSLTPDGAYGSQSLTICACDNKEEMTR
jgi:hypothetical protein